MCWAALYTFDPEWLYRLESVVFWKYFQNTQQKMRELLFLVLTVGAFEPSSLSQKVKMGLNSFLLDQFDMDVIRTEVKVSFSLSFTED